MQEIVSSVSSDFLKKCTKVLDETSQFEILSLLCKNASSKVTEKSALELIQTINKASDTSAQAGDDIQNASDVVLKKIIQFLVFFYQAKTLSRSGNSDPIMNNELFEAANLYIFNLLEFHTRQEKYALFFAQAIRKYLKFFKSKAPEFISKLLSYLDIQVIVSSLTTQHEVSEQDYTTKAALDLEKKYQIIFTLYSESIHILNLSPEGQKSLEGEYLSLGYLYLWYQGFEKEGEIRVVQMKSSGLVYGAENFISFFRRNLVSLIVDIHKILTNVEGAVDRLHLIKSMLRILQSNFEHFEKSTTKSIEEELFRPKILDYVRLLIHLYDVWPQQQKGDIFNKENEFFWSCLDKGLLIDDYQAKKITLQLLENIISDEKERLKKAKLADTKKFIAAYDKVWNCFLDLYKTLENYAAHLVKDLFPTIDILIKELEAKTLQELGYLLHNRKDLIFYKAKWLLSILLEKAATHKNDSITRYFIKGFLKLSINLDEMQDFIYKDLFVILNIGMFYKDGDLESDSRFLPIMSNFFNSCYSKLPAKTLKIHIRKFINALKTHSTLHNAIIGLLLTLQNLKSNEILIEKEDIDILVQIMKEHGPGFHLRKQHQMFQAIMNLLLFNTNTQEIGLDSILDIISCFPIDFLNMSYKSTRTKELILEISTLENSQGVENILRQILAQDFDFYYKLFALLLVRFDLTKLYDQLSQHIIITFKDVTSHPAEFVTTLKTLRVLSIAYEIAESKQVLKTHYNAEFLEQRVSRQESNAVLDELLRPFIQLLSTIYKNTYLQSNVCIQLLKHFNSFLEIFSTQKDTRTKLSITKFVDQVFVDVSAYISLLLNKEINGEEDAGHTVDKTIASLLRHMLIIASQSQYSNVKCMLLSHSSKFLQDFISTFKSYLFSDKLEASRLSVLLLLFNSILDCYNREIQYSIHAGAKFFIENELFNNAIQFITKIKATRFKTGFTRIFEDYKQKFLINYLLLVSYDPSITGSPQYRELTEDIISSVIDVIDAHDIINAQNLFGLLKVVYIPTLVNKCRTESADNVDAALEEYKGVFKRGFSSLLQNDWYTFSQTQAFFEFIFDEKAIVDPSISTRNEIKECIIILLKQCEKKFLLLRIFVNHFLKVLLKNPHVTRHYTKIIRKLLCIKEFRGFEAEIYDKLINEKRDEEGELLPLISTTASYYGAYTRLYTIVYLDQFVSILEQKTAASQAGTITEQEKEHINDMKIFLEDFTRMVIQHHLKGKPNDVVMPYSDQHRKKAHLSQALCVIMRVFTKHNHNEVFQKKLGLPVDFLDYLEKTAWKTLDFNNLPSVRQYHEIFILHLLRNFPERFVPPLEKSLKQKNHRTQFLVSIAWLSGYYILENMNDPHAEELFTYFFPHVASNTAYVRAIGQFFAMEYLQKKGADNIDHPQVREFYETFAQVDQRLNMCKKFDEVLLAFQDILIRFDIKTLLTNPFDDFGEILHGSVLEKFKAECVEMMSFVKLVDTPPPKKEELWSLYLSMNAKEANQILRPSEDEGITNFQKKIEIDEEFFPNDILLNVKQQENLTEKMDIIIVATLLEKIPNFANLTRTCEIFSVCQLVVPNIKMIEDEAFKAISVTAEKWMNMIEVKEIQLADYLRYKKLCGYTLIGLEQTRESTSLEKFKFPEKCVLLLGNEREGTPIKYIEMLDAFIEIPQYGKIRSLNVHISAVICIWECVKQKKGLKSIEEGETAKVDSK